ncbi:MAG: hypothetical protein BWY65_02284 [Firmicutes bacterium ADurb.Bin373]|nr:MAG: hypothetical protein BWY65_02284 [Firmicutes bacterium ADurb.Bin373]
MKAKSLIGVCGFSYVFVLCFITGCFASKGVVPVRGSKNTFALEDKLKRDVCVSSVEVFECDSKGISKGLVWEIQTNEKIPAENFQVTVGEIPSNFYQKIPSLPTVFYPKEGVLYDILIVPARMAPSFGPPHEYFYYIK